MTVWPELVAEIEHKMSTGREHVERGSGLVVVERAHDGHTQLTWTFSAPDSTIPARSMPASSIHAWVVDGPNLLIEFRPGALPPAGSHEIPAPPVAPASGVSELSGPDRFEKHVLRLMTDEARAATTFSNAARELLELTGRVFDLVSGTTVACQFPWSPLPNPGSNRAREQGCVCPSDDNNYGFGNGYKFGTPDAEFDLIGGCPLHWPDPARLP